MQQTIQSYNQYKVQSTNTTLNANGSAQIVIGSGVYDIDGSVVGIVYNGVNAATTVPIYARCDCFLPSQSAAIVTWDGVQRGQYLNLTAAQLAYAQDQDTFQGKELDQSINQDGSGVATSIKKFKKIGNGFGAAKNYVQTYQLRHFLPYIFNDDKYFKVDTMMNVTINFGSVALTDCLARQAVAGDNVNAALIGNTTCASFDLFFLLKRVTNAVEQAASTISPHITCYLQQQQLIGTGTTFNQSFGQNQVSVKQQLCLIPTGATFGTQFNFEDAASGSATANITPTLTIQRCGVIILQAPLSGTTFGMSDIYEQLQLQKSVGKKDYQNMIVTFDTVFSNANLQTIFQYTANNGSPLTAIMGYTYITQLPQQLPL